jgi:hypothetical protein
MVTSLPGHFTFRKELQYPLIRRLIGPQRQSGHFVEEKNLLPLQGFEPQAIEPVL